MVLTYMQICHHTLNTLRSRSDSLHHPISWLATGWTPFPRTYNVVNTPVGHAFSFSRSRSQVSPSFALGSRGLPACVNAPQTTATQ